MAMRWLTAFIDRPAEDFDSTVAFWAAITGSSISAPRGTDGEFATLVPATGEPYLRVQRVVSGGGHHLDVHVGDVMHTVARAEELGASVEHELAGVPVMRSPAGLPYCVVADQGLAVVPEPVAVESGGPTTSADHLCIDVPAEHYEAECRFWATFTGRPLRAAGDPDYAVLKRSAELPLGLLLQRLGDDSPAPVASAHLDFGCDDVDAVVPAHERLGATVVAELPHWTVLADPAGYPYCLIRQPPSQRRGT